MKIASLALDGLRRTPLRVGLTCIGVAIAAGALLSMVGYALGIQEQALKPFESLGLLNNITVRPNEDDSRPLDDEALAELSDLPEVDLAYPDLRMRGIEVTWNEHTESAMVISLPREVGFLPFLQDLLTAGRFFDEKDSAQAVLALRLLGDLGFESAESAIGSRLSLSASGLIPSGGESFAFEKKEFQVEVVGVFNPPPMTPMLGGNTLLLPVELMKNIPGIELQPTLARLRAGQASDLPSYSRATVRVRHPRDVFAVETKIDEMGFSAESVLSRLDDIKAFFLVIDLLLVSVGTVALIVAALGIINTQLMAVLERRREIGVYKALGASDGDVRILFLTEAAFVGLVGGCGGLGLGRLVSMILEFGVNRYARNYDIPIDIAVFHFPAWLVFATVAFSMLISIVAGIYPAVRAAKTDPIQALRSQ